ncbi:MAG: hypothetical protein LBJ31_04400 [Treponema sp.]|nr:hypothetical protein [Treponema sp.]
MAKMKYVVQADYENGETLFVSKNGEFPVLSVDEAQVFLSEKNAQRVVDYYNDTATALSWEVAEY